MIPSRQEIRSERARRDFRYFVQQVEPEYDLQWFHERLCDEIQSWAEADDPYVLILQMPPGYAKSTYAKLFCAWYHGRDPDGRIVYTSYGQNLASEHCGDIQAVLTGDRYKELFPGTRISEVRVASDDKGTARRTMDRHDIIGHGGRLVAVGTGGSITGGRYDIGVIDDPLKGPEAAASPKIRDDQWRWYTRTLLTRKRPERQMRILVLLTRWNLDDLAGRIQEHQAGECKVVSFSALKEAEGGDPADPREVGEPLWPAINTKEELERLRRLDPAGFSSLYQQHPVPEGGTIIKADDIQHWTSLPGMSGEWVQSWDLRAGGKSPTSSYAVGQLWFTPRSEPANAYLVDQVRGRWDINETLQQIIEKSEDPIWRRATAKLIEDKADGRALVPMLKTHVAGIVGVNPIGDKVARLQAVAPLYRGGNVYIPSESIASWVREHVFELTTFPSGAHDDQVDAATQALSYLLIPDGKEKDDLDRWAIWR